MMRRLTSLFALLPQGLGCLGQSSDEMGSSREHRSAFATIAPSCYFMDADLLPWQSNDSDRLEDNQGNSSGRGISKYRWAPPKVYCSTWRHGDGLHREWATADSRSFTQTMGEPFGVIVPTGIKEHDVDFSTRN